MRLGLLTQPENCEDGKNVCDRGNRMSSRMFGCSVSLVVCGLVFVVAAWGADTPMADVKAETKPEVKKIPAFPGAEGGGIYTKGGRGGKVYEVTNLGDNGPGSFREALTAKGPRTVVFRTGGVIQLKSRITITEPFITIAGQTAPGDGICVKGETIVINTNDVVIRYMRFRRGITKKEDDAVKGYPTKNIVIDHCSFSWGTNEDLSLYRRRIKTEEGYAPTKNMTVQWSIASEGLDCSSRSRGGIWGGKNASFHHNLLACNSEANPSIMYGEGLDFRNNVIFNWRHKAIEGGFGPAAINIVANYFKPGPAAHGRAGHVICRPGERFWGKAEDRWGKWYIADNYLDGDEKVTIDNWTGVKPEDPNLDISRIRAKEAFAVAAIRQQDAKEACQLVLAGAGATLPRRDAVDARVVDMTRTGKMTYKNGIVKDPNEVGGWPQYKSGQAPLDTDHDGMPDEWEKKYGLDPNDPSDAAMDKDGDGYTNLEEYLNGTDPTVFVDYTKAQNNVSTLGQAK
jgi:pectate lyase